MRKKLVIVALVCLMLSIVTADRNKTKDNSTKNAEDNHECTSEITTTIKLPLFIRLFGKKPLRFIKKSISKILRKNFTSIKKHSNRSHSTLKDRKAQQTGTSANIFTTRNISCTTTAGEYSKVNSTERQTPRSGSWTRKTYVRDMSYYRRFVYTPERYVPSVKVRKYYTPGGWRYTQETTKRSTSKVNSNNEDIRIFTTAPIFKESTSKVKTASEELIESLAKHSNGGKRQRRCSVDDSSESEQGYTYLLRKKRPESTFNPYAYLTKLSNRPVFTGNYTPRRYPYSTAPAATTRTSAKAAITTKPKTFLRTLPKFMTTATTTPKPIYRTTLRQWARRYNTRTPQAIATSTAATDGTKLTGEGMTKQTPSKHFWVNNWNLRYMSYYMHPREHTYRTYQPPITTHNPSSQLKTTRAMYYLSQYWNKGYFSYYTNFDPPDESSHAFAKRLGYFPDGTTRFKKIRMMPKRYRPEGFIDLFSLDSFIRDINNRLEANQTYPPPHERDSISSSVEDVSYWFFFNNSVTIDQLNPGTRWKNKPRPTMKPMPSYFFRDSIVTRYYPPSHEQDLQKPITTLRKIQKTHSAASTTKPTSCWFFLRTSTTPSTAVHRPTSRFTMRLPSIRTYESKIRTSIPTLPTNKETTPPNIDPYGLLNKIIQYNVQIKRPLSRNGSNIHQSTPHPVNELPGILKLPFTLSPNMMMYTDFRGKQLFTLLGKYHIHKDNKTLQCVQNPSEFVNPFKVVAPPPQSGYYRIIQRHRIRDDVIEKNPAQISNVDMSDLKGHRKLLPSDRTVAVEIRFYPLRTTGTIKTWNEYLGSEKNKFSMAVLPTRSASLLPTR